MFIALLPDFSQIQSKSRKFRISENYGRVEADDLLVGAIYIYLLLRHDDDLFRGREFEAKFGIVATKSEKLLGAESDGFNIEDVFACLYMICGKGNLSHTNLAKAIILPVRNV